MIRRWDAERPGFVHVEFVLSGEGHELPVVVAGEFNEWDLDAQVLDAGDDGRLRTQLCLPEGRRYEFRYRDARGRWFNDDAADDYAPNEWGGMNGVVFT